jgi:hypothetical protein
MGEVMWWFRQQYRGTVLLLPFMADLLQGSSYMDGLDNQVRPMIQTLFLNNDAVF